MVGLVCGLNIASCVFVGWEKVGGVDLFFGFDIVGCVLLEWEEGQELV
jgi:hypothetical protein